jgi:hypothetical protein
LAVIARHQVKDRSGTCIFCGGSKMTKEHIWPRWLHKVLVTDEVVDVAVVTRPRTVAGRDFTEIRHLKRKGSRLTRQMRRVCRSCNGGWMSRLQMAAQPVVESLVRGQGITLLPEGQATLAAWIAMTAMVGEYTDPESVGATETERHGLMTTGRPPASWRIWIARYDGALEAPLYSHDSFGSYPDPGEPVRLNGQASILVLGRLFIYAVSLPFPRQLELFAAPLDRLLVPIPDQNGRPLTAPRGPLMDAEEFHEFADLMRSFLSQLAPLAPLPDEARPR